MHRKEYTLFLLFLLLLSSSCSRTEKKDYKAAPAQSEYEKGGLQGGYIVRHQEERLLSLPPPLPRTRPLHPWETRYCGAFPRITKEFFYCRGDSLHPVRVQEREGKAPLFYRDCGGKKAHGLPLRGGVEYISPRLIDLLNYVQEKTNQRVVITTGHRCPEHNRYCDPSARGWSSKHMIGAEVDFYVEGEETHPEKIIALLVDYYREDPDYATFTRYKREGLNVSTPPWENGEILIKLYLPDEGRDGDNQHPYPYLGIQLLYDRERGQKVRFSEEEAQNYLRH